MNQPQLTVTPDESLVGEAIAIRAEGLPKSRPLGRTGGTAEGAAKAASDSWPKVFSFLQRQLQP